MNKLFVACVLFQVLGLVLGYSTGILQIPLCDADGPYGCDPTFYSPPGNRFNCTQPNRQMQWANQAILTDNLVITAEIAGSPIVEYVPGNSKIDIKVQVLKPQQYYRGIMMYALNSKNVKVGTWQFLNLVNTKFQVRKECGNATLIHAQAETKLTTEYYTYITPPAGTGTLTFKILVKSGPANSGDFWKPKTPLVLNEFTGTVPAKTGTLRWLKAAVNQPCSTLCNNTLYGNNSRMACDARYFASTFIDSPASLVLNLRPHGILCNTPALLTCLSMGPSVTPADDYCYYTNAAECASFGKTSPNILCTSRQNATQRFCPCNTAEGLAAAPETPFLFVPPPPPKANSGSAVRPLAWLMAFVFAALSNKKVAFVAALFALIASAQAHNFLNLPSRSFLQASPFLPCPARTNLSPHVQVQVGQDFQVEWASAHNVFTYWVIVAAADEPKLATLKESMLIDYFNSAPALAGMNAAKGIINNEKYERFHRKPTNNTDNEVPVAGTAQANIKSNFFKKVIYPGDPLFIPRPVDFDHQGLLSPGSFSTTRQFFQVQYKNVSNFNDRRAEYFNAKYPFILSAGRFEHNVEQPSRPDLALLRVPTGNAPGAYIAWWKWSSYYDCVDIQAISAGPVPHLQTYGNAANSTDEWLKEDHALADQSFIQRLGTFSANADFGCMPIPPDNVTASFLRCQAACTEKGRCMGVTVMPLELPATNHFSKEDIPIPWNFTDTSKRQYCNQTTFLAKNTKPGTKVCFPVVLGDGSAFTTSPVVSAVNDVQHPAFFSTFWHRSQKRTFPFSTSSFVPIRSPEFLFGGGCIKCADRSISLQDNVVSPVWDIPSVCRNCDLEP